MSFLASIGEFTHFAVRSVLAAVLALVTPSLWLKHFYDVVMGSLALAMTAGLAIGVVIWLHTRTVLERTGTGAAEYLPSFLSAAVLLELAPIGAGLILAARTGAKLGAELAAMKVNEQIDALALLGASPIKLLIGPRVLAVTLAAPLIMILIAALALGSGYLMELTYGPATWMRYSQALLDGVVLKEVLPAALKTPVFGAQTALTACWMGLTATSGSEGVGTAATRSVVIAILAVLVSDIILVAVISALLG